MATGLLGLFCSSAVVAVRLAKRRLSLRRRVSVDTRLAACRVVVPAVLLLCCQISFFHFSEVVDGRVGVGAGICFSVDFGRFVLYLLAKGLELCSPWGCLFLVGGVVAGGGSSSRLPSLSWSGSASSSSRGPLAGLGGSASFFSDGWIADSRSASQIRLGWCSGTVDLAASSSVEVFRRRS